MIMEGDSVPMEIDEQTMTIHPGQIRKGRERLGSTKKQRTDGG